MKGSYSNIFIQKENIYECNFCLDVARENACAPVYASHECVLFCVELREGSSILFLVVEMFQLYVVCGGCFLGRNRVNVFDREHFQISLPIFDQSFTCSRGFCLGNTAAFVQYKVPIILCSFSFSSFLPWMYS